MTHDVLDRRLVSMGSIEAEFWEIDITSLDDDGVETSFEPSQSNVARVAGVSVIGQESSDYVFRYDKTDELLHVTDVGTASVTQSGADVGELEVVVFGQ